MNQLMVLCQVYF